MSIFEQAARKKFRFPSVKGDLTVEQLWDLPLTSAGVTRDIKADLDTIARGIHAELRSVTTESFVQTKPDPRKGELEAKLEVVKHIINVRLTEAEAAKNAAERAEKRRKLVEALAAKDEQAIQSMSKEDILKELAALEGK